MLSCGSRSFFQFGFVEEKTDGAINYNDKMDSKMTVQKGIDAVAKSKAKVALADAEGRYLTDTGKFSLEKYASENPLGGPTCEICGRPRNPQLLSVCCFDCESSMGERHDPKCDLRTLTEKVLGDMEDDPTSAPAGAPAAAAPA
mgnify:CR=1 FL=1